MSNEAQDRGFEILHLTMRYPKGGKYNYFFHNIVWRALDSDFKEICLRMCEEWRRTEVVFNLALAEEYLSGLDFEVSELDSQFGDYPIEIVQRAGIRHDTVFHEAWACQNPFVTYIEKFDCFRVHGFTDINPITLACIEDLRRLCPEGYMRFERHTHWNHFLRVIKALDTF